MLQSFHALIISGGSSGIGKSFVEHAYRYNPGLTVFNLSRSKPYFPPVGEKQLKLHHLDCDFADPSQVSKQGLELISLLDREVPVGRILLINNSGYGTYGLFPEPNLRRNAEMVDVNVRAPIELTGLLLPLLLRRGGAIINVASTAAFQPTANMATYGASKAFVLHWSLALSEELKSKGIGVLALCPGPTRTRFFSNAGLERPIIPETLGQNADQVVECAFRALASGKSLVVSGWKNKLGAAFGSALPKTWVTPIAAKMIASFRPAPGKAGHG